MHPAQDDLLAALDESLPQLQERDIVLITSKVVAIHQGRCVPIKDIPDKDKLIEQEADAFLSRDMCPDRMIMLTLKQNTLIATAGIDESNVNGYYILWPTDIQKTAKILWDHLRTKHNIQNLGIIITDSHSVPLRLGVLGIAIGFFGFEPLLNHRGKSDLFGRIIGWSQTNIPDSLAAAAVLVMGESNEQTPVAVARDIPNITFTDRDCYQQWIIEREKDIYAPLLHVFNKSSKKMP